MGLEDRLLWEEPSEVPAAARMRASFMMHRLSDHTREDWRVQDVSSHHGHYEITPPEPGASLACRLYGNPATLFTGTYHPADCHRVDFPDSVFGPARLGTTPEDCLPRSGELLAAGGVAAICRPTVPWWPTIRSAPKPPSPHHHGPRTGTRALFPPGPVPPHADQDRTPLRIWRAPR